MDISIKGVDEMGFDDGLSVGGAQIPTLSNWVETSVIHQGRDPRGDAWAMLRRQREQIRTQ